MLTISTVTLGSNPASVACLPHFAKVSFGTSFYLAFVSGEIKIPHKGVDV